MSTEVKQKVQLTIVQIKADLSEGLDRKAIGKKYNLNGRQVKLLFENPALKGLRTKKPLEAAFELMDEDIIVGKNENIVNTVLEVPEEVNITDIPEEITDIPVVTEQEGIW